MSGLEETERLLRRALVALPEYRDDVLLIGGLVPWLYRRLDGVQVPDHPAIATREADLSIKRPLPPAGRPLIAEQLTTSGFSVFQVPGLDLRAPRHQRFQDAADGGDRAASVFLEFLSPLRGKPVEGLVEPQAGLWTPALRYLDLLAHEALTIPLQGATDDDDVVAARVPHPAMYIAQKVLSRRSGRAATKQPKDMAYVYDVALMTQPHWSSHTDVLRRAADESGEWAAWLRRARDDLERLFKDEDADGCAEVLHMMHAVQPPPTTRGISTVLQRYLAKWPT